MEKNLGGGGANVFSCVLAVAFEAVVYSVVAVAVMGAVAVAVVLVRPKSSSI